VDPGATYQAEAKLTEVDDTPPPTDPNSVLYQFDESKAEATASVPLRVVLVGFQQGEVDAAKVLSQIPRVPKAAAYRDLAFGVPRGTTELGQGTKLHGAASCASATG
jgi:hypothetical protein